MDTPGFQFCAVLSAGVTVGVLLGAIKMFSKGKEYTPKQIELSRKMWKTGSMVLAFVTGLLLVLGLIWCSYFLFIGVVYPELSEYANNISELIAAVLTVISILFAFVEFLRRK